MLLVFALICIASRALGHGGGYAAPAVGAAADPSCNSCPARQNVAPAPSCMCPPPENIQNGIYLVAGQLAWTCGSAVQYQCSSGYRLVGPSSVTCQQSGTWTGVPKCEEILCPAPEDIQDGRTIAPQLTVGSTAEFECNDGYRLVGAKRAVCQSDSMWSENPPRCMEIQCPDPRPPRNGTVSMDGRKIGSKATYSCKYKYSVFGDETAECLPHDSSRGEWSSPTPFCVPASSLKNGSRWGKETEPPVQCPEPDTRLVNGFAVVDHAKNSYGLKYTVATTIKYKCDEYNYGGGNAYTLEGEDTVTCLPDGTWSSTEIPRCVAAWAQAPNYL